MDIEPDLECYEPLGTGPDPEEEEEDEFRLVDLESEVSVNFVDSLFLRLSFEGDFFNFFDLLVFLYPFALPRFLSSSFNLSFILTSSLSICNFARSFVFDSGFRFSSFLHFSFF